MAESSLGDQKLVELYYRYVGEPERMRDVYGYWLFLLGCLAGLLGVLLYLFEQALQPGNLAIREVAIVLASSGLTVVLFGIVVLLPVRRRGILASVVGLVISAAAIGAFTWVYPSAWYVPPDYSAEIIAVYTIGIGVIAAVAVLVPIVTGEKGLLVEPELGIGRDEPPILLGETDRDAFFAIYETPTKEWTWRIIERDAIAESVPTASTDTDARLHVESIRETIAEAGLLDLATAAFRLYQTPDGEWQWSLVRQDGSGVATSETTIPNRDAVESDVTLLKERLPDADLLDITGGAFDVFEDNAERWQWRLIDDRRTPLAKSPTDYADESDATAATATFVDRIAGANTVALDTVGFELSEEEAGAWRWHVIDSEDERYLTSDTEYGSRSTAEAAATDVAADLAESTVIERGRPRFEVVPQRDGWSWTLRDDADASVIARDGDPVSRDAAFEAAERAADVIPSAEIVEFDGIDYEVFPTDDGWAWRLVSEDRRLIAESAERFADAETATGAAETVQDRALVADLLEFDQAAFQQYESDGEWRWRLIDEDGRVMADSGEGYDSKDAVREGMETLKEHAPDAELLEIDQAAFEIYRTKADTYAWRLIDEGGNLIAENASEHETRSAAREAVEFLIETIDAASIRPMETAIFQLDQCGDGWSGTLVDADGSVLATTTSELLTRDDAVRSIEEIRSVGETASVKVVGPVTVQLRDDGEWRWHLITPDRDRIATGARRFEAPDDAAEAAEFVIDAAEYAPTIVIGDAAVQMYRKGESWHWRLLDADRTIYAVSATAYESRDDVETAIDRLKAIAPEAGRFEIETVAFELLEENGSWNWRVLDPDERTLAVSAGEYDSRADAEDAIDRTRSTAAESSILEIDEPAFEFHEREDGWIWRLIDEHGSPLAAGVRAHESRRAAREEMQRTKEHAPDGETVVTW